MSGICHDPHGNYQCHLFSVFCFQGGLSLLQPQQLLRQGQVHDRDTQWSFKLLS